MPVHIRPADLPREKSALVQLFRRFLSLESDDQRFDWLYLNGPHGTGQAWVACETEGGNIIGAAAAFPRELSIAGRSQRAWVLGDFCLDPKFRSLGPALALQRTCLRESCAIPGEFCYDLPSQSMTAIYARLGIAETGRLVRWVKLLSLTPKIRSAVRSATIANAIGTPVEFFLRRRGGRSRDNVAQLQLHEGHCSSEFSELNAQVCTGSGTFTSRSAEYLNWRYLDHPGGRHAIMTARRSGVLVAYAVFRREDNRLVVADICSIDEPQFVLLLLAGVTEQGQQCGAEALNLVAADSHPWSELFRRAGFHPRETSPLMTCGIERSGEFDAKQITAWHFMNGERES